MEEQDLLAVRLVAEGRLVDQEEVRAVRLAGRIDQLNAIR